MKKLFIAVYIMACACTKTVQEVKPATIQQPDPVPIPVATNPPTLFQALQSSTLPSAIVCVGSYLTYGDSNQVTYPDQLSQMLNGQGVNNATVYNKGLPAEQGDPEYLLTLISDSVNPYLIHPGSNIAVVWEISLDLYENRTSDWVYLLHFKNYCDSLRSGGWKIVIVTAPYRNTWYTTGDYTPSGYDSTEYMAEINGLNDSLRVNWNKYGDALADVAADDRLSHYDQTYFLQDRVSLTSEGNRIVAQIVLQSLQKN